MKTTTNLNENEIKVLNHMVNMIFEQTRGEFADYSDKDLKLIEGLSLNQVKGYLAQLQKKDILCIYEDSSDRFVRVRKTYKLKTFYFKRVMLGKESINFSHLIEEDIKNAYDNVFYN